MFPSVRPSVCLLTLGKTASYCPPGHAPSVLGFLDAPSHLYKRLCPSVRPSVRMSRVIFEGEKNAYKAHLVLCIRPCSFSPCFFLLNLFVLFLLPYFSIFPLPVLVRFSEDAEGAAVHPAPAHRRSPAFKAKHFEFVGKLVGKSLFESAQGATYALNVNARYETLSGSLWGRCRSRCVGAVDRVITKQMGDATRSCHCFCLNHNLWLLYIRKVLSICSSVHNHNLG